MQLDSKCVIFAGSRTGDMGNFERNNTVRKEREERDFKVREKLSGFFFDLAKLLLATITIASLSPMFTGSEAPVRIDLSIAGLIGSIIMFLIGYVVLNKR